MQVWMNKVQENKTQNKYKGPTKKETNLQVEDKMPKSVEVQSNEKRYPYFSFHSYTIDFDLQECPEF